MMRLREIGKSVDKPHVQFASDLVQTAVFVRHLPSIYLLYNVHIVYTALWSFSQVKPTKDLLILTNFRILKMKKKKHCLSICHNVGLFVCAKKCRTNYAPFLIFEGTNLNYISHKIIV